MIKHLKSNKIISLFLFIICIIMIIKPLTYAKCFLNGVSIWALKVLPLLFPFFVITKIIVQTVNTRNFQPQNNIKLFRNDLLTFILSAISGYPMGAKLILEQHKTGNLGFSKAKTLMAFCSVSGPMFMIGTVGLGFLASFRAGIIILVSNIFGAILNGLLWAKLNKKNVYNQPANCIKFNKLDARLNITNIVYDSLISILMIGAYISISFILIEILNELKLINLFSSLIYYLSFKTININCVKAFIIGLIEITCGVFKLSQAQSSLFVKTIISSCLISFGGFSILLQNLGILSEIGISWKYIIKQKFTHAIFSVLITYLLCFCFMH